MNDPTARPTTHLRPKERVIKRLSDGGMSDSDIAWRFRSSPRHIQRTLRLIDLPRGGRAPVDLSAAGSTARERTVVKARSRGLTHAEIGARMRRSPSFVARVEQFAALRAEGGYAS